MPQILLVNIPSDSGKKSYDKAFPFSKTINFGLLSIATYLKDKGLDVLIFDPFSKYYRDYKRGIVSEIQETMPLAIGLSCISGFNYPPLKSISILLKKKFPDIPIITGGKDHVGLIPQEVLLDCGEIDIVIRGEAEIIIYKLMESIINKQPISGIPNIVYRDENGNIKETPIVNSLILDTIPSLDYRLYPNYLSFPPSIEVSRGCPHSCKFCVHTGTKIRKKPVAQIIEDVGVIIQLYKIQNPCLYFETPIFSFNNTEIEELIDLKKGKEVQFTWRTETRVDYLSPDRINRLAKAGLKVIDLGLESGVPEILARMNKTQNPEKYLKSAAIALKSAYENDIIIKINLLFYIGETRKTLIETIKFLEQNQQYVQSVSAYPLIAYPGMIDNVGLQSELESFGGSIDQSKKWKERHLMAVNPSDEFTYRELDEEIGILIGKSYQSIQTFYNQKIYGYFPHNVSYSEFETVAKSFGIEKLPFFYNAADRINAKNSLMRILAG